MVPKTWRDPDSETRSVTFAFASLGGVLAAGSVGALDLWHAALPGFYFCLANGAIALLIVHRRRVIAARSLPATASRPERTSTSAIGCDASDG